MALWSGVLLGDMTRYGENGGIQESSSCRFLSFTSANAKTEGYIEGAMRNLKQEDFPGKRRLRADVFVLQNYERIRRRERNYGDGLHVYLKKQKKRRYEKRTKNIAESNNESDSDLPEMTYHTSQERWGKKDPETPKQNPKLGRYQQSPSIPLSVTPNLKKNKSKSKTLLDKTDRDATLMRSSPGKRKFMSDMTYKQNEADSTYSKVAVTKMKIDDLAENKHEDVQVIKKDKYVTKHTLIHVEEKEAKIKRKKRLSKAKESRRSKMDRMDVERNGRVQHKKHERGKNNAKRTTMSQGGSNSQLNKSK
ncbi:uncharacterized protein LOC124459168 [Xenia sp. Carnegie-2017]|uniref:uncharacterized protein LOC124459168 n=1 Tax=Xenia sp. Carnegie-2017 TaxID=2897299 RepID=UPI001F03A559|nr:uncharacterized protein LOC124459168 [Xenia sp. Carnegie-2017]